MKNNTKYLIIALGCVVVLGGAVAALTLTGGRPPLPRRSL